MWNLTNSYIQRTNRWLPDARMGGMGEGGQKGQADSYKVSPSDIMHSVVIIVNNAVLYI